MADTESILQLGIEAARAGDKDEARNLFRLLTREAPDDPQAWLWLAGVAEDSEEKRAALEHVTRLDPTNDLARQGLNALGGPRATPAPSASTPPVDDFSFDFGDTQAMSTPPPSREPSREPARTRELSADEEFAMSLDSLGSISETMNERKAAGNDDLAGFNVPDFSGFDDEPVDMDAYLNRKRVDPSEIEIVPDTSAKDKKSKAAARAKATTSAFQADRDRLKAEKAAAKANRASGGLRPLLLMLAGAAVVVFLIWFLFFRGGEEAPPVADLTPAQQTATAAARPAGTPDPGGVITPTNPLPTLAPGVPTAPPLDPNVPTVPPLDPNVPTVPPLDPGVVPTTPPASGNFETTLHNPALLANDGFQTSQVNGWFFTFGGGSQVINGPIGTLTPANGRWLVVVPLVFNGTGQDVPIPGDLFAVKDAQGRLYRSNPAASEAYFTINPGAFNIHQAQNAPQGFNFYMPLVFDVPADATDLVFYSTLLPEQGYLVRNNVQ